MRWKKTSHRPYMPDYFRAQEKIHEAFREGYINRCAYILAIERVDKSMNGDWMLEKPKAGDKSGADRTGGLKKSP